MTASELRKRNKELAKLNLRICRTHRGKPLPLTDEYFQHVGKGSVRLVTECKQCHNRRIGRRKQERFHADPAFAQRILETARQSNHRHMEARRERARSAAREKSVIRAIQPIPAGMAVVAYDRAQVRLRAWGSNGRKRLTIPCAPETWTLMKAEYLKAGYWTVPEWKRFEVLATFEFEAADHFNALDARTTFSDDEEGEYA